MLALCTQPWCLCPWPVAGSHGLSPPGPCVAMHVALHTAERAIRTQQRAPVKARLHDRGLSAPASQCPVAAATPRSLVPLSSCQWKVVTNATSALVPMLVPPLDSRVEGLSVQEPPHLPTQVTTPSVG